MRHPLSLVQRKAHWPRHMVERFLQADYELLAMLSNGKLLATPLTTLQWRRVLAETGRVRAVAVARTEKCNSYWMGQATMERPTDLTKGH